MLIELKYTRNANYGIPSCSFLWRNCSRSAGIVSLQAPSYFQTLASDDPHLVAPWLLECFL